MLVAKPNQIIYPGGKKKRLITMNSFGVIHLLFATVRSESGVHFTQYMSNDVYIVSNTILPIFDCSLFLRLSSSSRFSIVTSHL